ncbi:MAG: RNA polymerase Rpb4 family protein [Candidatus Micrarchaeota archaeon]|nr:RNA polymerase Rpb4 family protein [Candidatus Micrarchaeota archaeon]
MVGRKELEIKPITLAEVYEIMQQRLQESEIGYEQQTTLSYVEKFKKLNKKQSQELIEKLLEIEGMNLETAIKIADILPKFKETLLLILAKDKIILDDSKIEQIMKYVKEYEDKARYSSSSEEKEKEKKEAKDKKE